MTCVYWVNEYAWWIVVLSEILAFLPISTLLEIQVKVFPIFLVIPKLLMDKLIFWQNNHHAMWKLVLMFIKKWLEGLPILLMQDFI